MSPLLSVSGGGAAWLWLVLVPVSGWLLMHSRLLRSRIWRAAGYSRYFLIVLAGIFAFIIGMLFASAFGDMARSGPPIFARIWELPLNIGGGPKDNEPLNRDFLVLFWGAPIGFLFGLAWHIFELALLILKLILLASAVFLHASFLYIKGISLKKQGFFVGLVLRVLKLPWRITAFFLRAPLLYIKGISLKKQGFFVGLVLRVLKLPWRITAFFLRAPLLYIKGISLKKQMIDEPRAEYLAEVNGLLGFVVEAFKQELAVMLTLSNRKVYIGWPLRLSDWNNPRPTNQYLYLLPLLSGYREEDSLELAITTSYADAHRKFGTSSPSPKVTGWEIILPVNEIVHAQPFDLEVYQETQWFIPDPKSSRKK